MANNRLEGLRGLDSFAQLLYLDLKKNILKSLEGVNPLRRLKYLDVSDNRLSSLIGAESFPVLETLLACRNVLKTVTNLKPLVRLAHLDLRQNCISTLEGLPGKMAPNVSTLYLDANPLVELVHLLYLRPFARLENLSLGETPLARKLQKKCLALGPCVELLTNLSLTVINFQQLVLDRHAIIALREGCPLSTDELDDCAFLPLAQLKSPRFTQVLELYLEQHCGGYDQSKPLTSVNHAITPALAEVLEKSRRLTAESLRHSNLDGEEYKGGINLLFTAYGC